MSKNQRESRVALNRMREKSEQFSISYQEITDQDDSLIRIEDDSVCVFKIINTGWDIIQDFVLQFDEPIDNISQYVKSVIFFYTKEKDAHIMRTNTSPRHTL